MNQTEPPKSNPEEVTEGKIEIADATQTAINAIKKVQGAMTTNPKLYTAHLPSERWFDDQ